MGLGRGGVMRDSVVFGSGGGECYGVGIDE